MSFLRFINTAEASLFENVKNILFMLFIVVPSWLFGTSVQPLFEHFYKWKGFHVPWDIGRAQPVVADAARQGVITGKVLDVGTGLGDNAVALAASGLKVTAIDLSDAALQQAEQRARKAGPPATDNLTFKQANLLDAASLRAALGSNQFDTVLDSAVFHCFNASEREAYLANLSAYVKPGGKLFMFVFSDKNPSRLLGPHRISRACIHKAFNEGSGWHVDSIQDEKFSTAGSSSPITVEEGNAKAVRAVITKA